MKRLTVAIAAVFLLLNLSGCVVFLGGAAGGAGTAVWLSGKVSEEVDASFAHSIKAAESALDSLRLEITKKTEERDVAQIMSKYTDGKTIWVDIRRIADRRSKIEVRVGAVSSDKEAANKILKRIIRYL